VNSCEDIGYNWNGIDSGNIITASKYINSDTERIKQAVVVCTHIMTGDRVKECNI
jgi:hypothetical protein